MSSGIDRRNLLKFAAAAAPLVLIPQFAYADPGALYGMIEIGASGIKVAAYRFTNDVLADETTPGSGFERLAPKREGDSYTINTNIRIGSPADIAETTAAAKQALDRLLGQGLDRSNILMVASSGVASSKSEGVFEELKDQIKKATGFELQAVKVEDETRLSFDWIVLGARRSQVLLIDVGSGNTKGGYYENLGQPQQRFRYFSLPYGTKSLAAKVKGAWPNDPVAMHAAQTFKEDPELAPSLARQIASAPGLVSKPRAYLSGGMVWATAMLTRPTAMADKGPWIRLSASHFAQVRAQVAAGKPYAAAIPTTISADKRAWIDKTLGNVRDTFTPDQLAAGAAICEGLAKQLEFGNRAAIFFASFAVDAWSSEFLFEKFGHGSAG